MQILQTRTETIGRENNMNKSTKSRIDNKKTMSNRQKHKYEVAKKKFDEVSKIDSAHGIFCANIDFSDFYKWGKPLIDTSGNYLTSETAGLGYLFGLYDTLNKERYEIDPEKFTKEYWLFIYPDKNPYDLSKNCKKIGKKYEYSMDWEGCVNTICEILKSRIEFRLTQLESNVNKMLKSTPPSPNTKI